jgi:hypothetical protein
MRGASTTEMPLSGLGYPELHSLLGRKIQQ